MESDPAWSSSETSSTGGGSDDEQKPSMTLEQAMQEVEIRFLMNLPEEELSSVDRLFFQVEQAHWHYEDFLADLYTGLPHFSLEKFSETLFSQSQLLLPLRDKLTILLKDFNSYKYSVPVYGAALLNTTMDQILLVCNWQGTSWGLPRGKVNQGETPIECAARETLEECGYDPSSKIREDDSFFVVQNSKHMKVYVVRGVPEDFPFRPQVRKEVKEARFWPIDDLPRNSYNVQPCVAHVKRWISQHQRGKGGKRKESSTTTTTSRGRGGYGGGAATAISSHRLSSSSSTTTSSRSRSAPIYRDPYDANNTTTFGSQDTSWDANAMFKANEKLTGKKFTYDGNPQSFGDYARSSSTTTTTTTNTNTKELGGSGSSSTTTSAAVKGGQKHHHHPIVDRRGSCPVTTSRVITTSTTTTDVVPAVAALLGLATKATTSSIGGSATTTTPSLIKSSSIHSCSSIEASSQASTTTTTTTSSSSSSSASSTRCADGEPGGMDLLGGFQFDTSEILSALQF